VIIISQLCDPKNDYLINRFIEITNVGTAGFDLTGHRIVVIQNNGDVSDFTFTLSGVINAGQSLVCGDDQATGFTPDFVEADWNDSNSSWNGKEGDGARLMDLSKGTIDEVLGVAFNDKSLVRNEDATTPQSTTETSEWTSSGVNNSSDANPGSHQYEETLPVELSSFTATASSTTSGSSFVAVTWKTGSESEMIGYNVLRSKSNNVDTAFRINQEIIASENLATGSQYSLIDSEVEENNSYYYWLVAMDLNNQSEMFGPIIATILDNNGTEGIVIPRVTSLDNIYPNPFNPSASVSFYMDSTDKVKISVYNAKGQFVKQIANDEYNEGSHSAVWNGKDMNGADCSSGIYFFRMESSSKTEMIKGLLVK
ncbi:MAG: hypothetical protein B6226_00455, partial [Candidatus Cloacimonetes bacterium 4572_65]